MRFFGHPRHQIVTRFQALRNMEEERERLILARTKPTPRIGEALHVIKPYLGKRFFDG